MIALTGLWLIIGCSPTAEQSKGPYVQLEVYYPSQELGALFHDIQMNQVFHDGKTFVDYHPKYDVEDILDNYDQQVDLKLFVQENFVRFPDLDLADINTTNRSMEDHLPSHWSYLTRLPDTTSVSGSLLPLPKPYVGTRR